MEEMFFQNSQSNTCNNNGEQGGSGNSSASLQQHLAQAANQGQKPSFPQQQFMQSANPLPVAPQQQHFQYTQNQQPTIIPQMMSTNIFGQVNPSAAPAQYMLDANNMIPYVSAAKTIPQLTLNQQQQLGIFNNNNNRVMMQPQHQQQFRQILNMGNINQANTAIPTQTPFDFFVNHQPQQFSLADPSALQHLQQAAAAASNTFLNTTTSATINNTNASATAPNIDSNNIPSTSTTASTKTNLQDTTSDFLCSSPNNSKANSNSNISPLTQNLKITEEGKDEKNSLKNVESNAKKEESKQNNASDRITKTFTHVLKQRLISEANILQSRHKYKDAIQVFDQVLEIDPTNTTIQNSKGVCYKSLHDNQKAMECYRNAIKISPDDQTSHNNCGVIYKDLGKFSEAIECYKRAIKLGPKDCMARMNMAIVLTDIGTTYKVNGQIDLSAQNYKKACEIQPDQVSAYFNLGVIYSENGSFDKALEYYRIAVEKNPSYVEALCNIGVIYKNQGKLDLAIQFYQRALSVNPNFEIANNNLAIAYTDMGTVVKNGGKVEDGIKYYKQALLHNPKYPDAQYNLGVAYAEQHKIVDAIICYETAIGQKPKCPEAYNNLGVIYKERGNLQKAILYYEKALEANPKFSHTLNNLGVIYTMMGKTTEAYKYCIQAIQANRNYAEAWNNLGVLYRDEGLIMNSIQSYNHCLRLDPNSRNAGQNKLLALNYLDSIDVESVTQYHRQQGRSFASLYRQCTQQANDQSDAKRVLRVGYISPDFFAHSVSYFIEAPITYANRKNTEIFCYSNVSKEDYKTEIIRSRAHNQRTIQGMEKEKIVELIRNDKIDILVDLTGHTAGNRLDVMAMKPAPIQVTQIGYPNTTGLPTIDYRISDSIVDPVDSGQQCVEQLIRMPEPSAFLCYTPYNQAPNVNVSPALSNHFVTFGSFNNLAKITPTVIQTQSEILRRVPHSRLLMKCKPFATESVRERVLSYFVEKKIESKRIDLVPLMNSTNEHLMAYSMIDIALDSFPYAGTTTTCEAMYMGVPVVTLAGKCHAQNVGVSLLSRTGHKFLIANSIQNYISVAVNLATKIDENGDLSELNSIRNSMRKKMLESPLCNGEQFTANLEKMYRVMQGRYCDKMSKEAAQSNNMNNSGANIQNSNQNFCSETMRSNLDAQQASTISNTASSYNHQLTPNTSSLNQHSSTSHYLQSIENKQQALNQETVKSQSDNASLNFFDQF